MTGLPYFLLKEIAFSFMKFISSKILFDLRFEKILPNNLKNIATIKRVPKGLLNMPVCSRVIFKRKTARFLPETKI